MSVKILESDTKATLADLLKQWSKLEPGRFNAYTDEFASIKGASEPNTIRSRGPMNERERAWVQRCVQAAIKACPEYVQDQYVEHLWRAVSDNGLTGKGKLFAISNASAQQRLSAYLYAIKESGGAKS